MARGSINHLALTASDLARSTEFYDKVLGFMGYGRVEVSESTQQAMNTRLHAWASPGGSVTLRPARVESALKQHDRNAPGLNHVAFNAENRADVEKMHDLLEKIGARILDPPLEYPYFPGYFAVYFCDPDGLKIEFVFWQRS
ncbi:MAG TPA: VOC family protein [Candidatus Binataceae bacterium]|nr:VOC family protein [Candidatus Binataceae bacterium]